MNSELEFVLNELAQYTLFGDNNKKSKYKKEEIKLTGKDKKDRELYNKFNDVELKNYWRENEENFYKQAKLVENFECNFEYKDVHRDSYDLFRYCGSYEGFSFNDFRTYFSWRTKIRKGIFEEIGFEYEQIYINELVNKIGCKDADDAIEKLIAFWIGYREYSEVCDSEMRTLLKNFI